MSESGQQMGSLIESLNARSRPSVIVWPARSLIFAHFLHSLFLSNTNAAHQDPHETDLLHLRASSKVRRWRLIGARHSPVWAPPSSAGQSAGLVAGSAWGAFRAAPTSPHRPPLAARHRHSWASRCGPLHLVQLERLERPQCACAAPRRGLLGRPFRRALRRGRA